MNVSNEPTSHLPQTAYVVIEWPPISCFFQISKSDVDPDLNLEDELHEASDHHIAKIEKIEVEERLHEMEKVVVSLQTENRRLQTVFASTTNPSSSSSMQDSFRSVEDEVDDVLDVRYTEGQKKRYSSPQHTLHCGA